MLKKLSDNPNIVIFFQYCISFMAFGMLIAGIGPTIPYLAVKLEKKQTDFNIFFLTRGIGFMIGALISKKIHKYASYHTILIICSLGAGIPFLLYGFSQSFNLCVLCIFISAIFGCILQISLIVCIVNSHRNNNEDFWLQMSYGIMGVGCLVIPLAVNLLSQQGLYWITIAFVIPIPLYFKINSPEIINVEEQQKKQQDKMLLKMEFRDQMILGMCVFMYFGQEVGFSGWISSYAVLLKVQTNQQAALLSSLFFGSLTITRFILLLLLDGPVYKKLLLLIKSQILILLVAIVLQAFGLINVSAYFSSFFLGCSFSTMYPFILALPLSFNRELSQQVSSNLILLGVMGEGILTYLLGFAMNVFGAKALYPSILLFVSTIGIFLMVLVNKWLQEETKQINKEFQMKLFSE